MVMMTGLHSVREIKQTGPAQLSVSQPAWPSSAPSGEYPAWAWRAVIGPLEPCGSGAPQYPPLGLARLEGAPEGLWTVF